MGKRVAALLELSEKSWKGNNIKHFKGINDIIIIKYIECNFILNIKVSVDNTFNIYINDIFKILKSRVNPAVHLRKGILINSLL